MTEALKEVRIEVQGRVQAVFFRRGVKRYADYLGITGSTMNLPGGSVLIVGQGPKKDVETFVAWVKKNPLFSKVESISAQYRDITEREKSFRIIRSGNYLVDKWRALKTALKIEQKPGKVPSHIAIIPDGNRRWARSRGITAYVGHYKAGSYQNMASLFREARRLGVKTLSLWAWSTENWKRSENEQQALFELVRYLVGQMRKDATTNKMRFKHIGRKDRLPKDLIKEIKALEKETSTFEAFTFQLCMDYGGRDEILRAVNKMLKDNVKEVTKETFDTYLDTSGTPDPELIIRTSGEQRLSGFMPWQNEYSEFYFPKVHFPSFDAHELRKAVLSFGNRKRRFGGN